MTINNSPFQITTSMVNQVAEIAELVGRLTVTNRFSSDSGLRRNNRIRTIYGSLAIEQDTLSREQVGAVLNGKHVLASPETITAVKNAYEIYEKLDQLNPYNLDDLLMAHNIMTRGLTEESGVLRTQPVCVVDQGGQVLHYGSLPAHVPRLTERLLEQTKTSNVHMLIRSCVFHYEFELIHPFAEGNGRIGRLWHTLLLSKWNPLFAWLPIESVIHDNQQAYYNAINQANDEVDCTAFVEFMLSIIKSSVLEAIDTSAEMSKYADKASARWAKIKGYLNLHDFIMNADVRDLCGVSAATANRILNGLVEAGQLSQYREGKHWAYLLRSRTYKHS